MGGLIKFAVVISLIKSLKVLSEADILPYSRLVSVLETCLKSFLRTGFDLKWLVVKTGSFLSEVNIICRLNSAGDFLTNRLSLIQNYWNQLWTDIEVKTILCIRLRTNVLLMICLIPRPSQRDSNHDINLNVPSCWKQSKSSQMRRTKYSYGQA